MSKGKGDVRQRIKNVAFNDGNSQSADKVKFKRFKKKDDSNFANFKLLAIVVGISFFLILTCCYCGYNYILYDAINSVRKPINLPLISTVTENGDLNFWGTYRPQLFFGMKSRDDNSILSGLLWFTQPGQARRPDIRYWCRNDGGIKKFGWNIHDGSRIGNQVIQDNHQTISTSFVKNEVSWVSKIDVVTHKPRLATSLMWYLYIPNSVDGFFIKPIFNNNQLTKIKGQTAGLGEFVMSFNYTVKNLIKQRPHFTYLVNNVPREDKVLETIENSLGYNEREAIIGLVGKSHVINKANENIWVFEATAVGNFSLYITYETKVRGDIKPLSKETFQSYYDKHLKLFNEKFEKTFQYNANNLNKKHIELSKSVLSNLIGGIGYFYGQGMVTSSLMQTKGDKNVLLYWPTGLLTGTPSRTMFPRGFLWDEGFHTMLLARWNPIMALDIVSHWLDLLNTDGWIPREQILGWEARAKVPDEFIVQDSKNGNPPTLLFTLEDLNNRYDRLDKETQKYFTNFLNKAIPRLEAWFKWFNTTQIGNGYANYMWKGRNADNPKLLNPLTLSSGFDDYPRASHPSESERHVDLRCWMAVFARLLTRLKQRIHSNSNLELFSSWSNTLHSQSLLDSLYWDPNREIYSDWGLHSENIKLERKVVQINENNMGPKEFSEQFIRVVHKKPVFQAIPHTGYISFFPLLLQVLSVDSPKLNLQLDKLRTTLWTKHGLRSLATTSSMYRVKNSEHDPPYWRGAIWINMNILALRSLKHYSLLGSDKATKLYRELRLNLINTVLGNYERTGYLWEQYDDITGQGQRAHPFSGWTALVVLALEE